MKESITETLEVIFKRKSIRAYQDKSIPDSEKEKIIKAAIRAPTAGNMMLYSIIEVDDQRIKDKLVETCDGQPFIARAPMVLLFVADYQRWYDYFLALGIHAFCDEQNLVFRNPQEGDLFLACCDALIAAHSSVIAAQSMGVGSCYIGDIMENYETHRDLFNLPEYCFPIILVCYGYPNKQQTEKDISPRFERDYIVHRNRYNRLEKKDFPSMSKPLEYRLKRSEKYRDKVNNLAQYYYLTKFSADFCLELNRSVREALKNWRPG